MRAPSEFSLAEAERLLGPDVMEHAQRLVDEAPPLSPEIRAQLRAVFVSARQMRDLPAADAA